MDKGWRRGSAWRTLAAGAALLGCVAGWQPPAVAGSDHVVFPYAGDYLLLALPEGTIGSLTYNEWRHGDVFIQNSNNLFGATGHPKHMDADVGVYAFAERLAYLTSFLGHPLALEVAIPYAAVTEAKLETVSPVTVNDGLLDIDLFFDYGLIVEPKNQRYLDITNNFIVPTGNYDKFKTLNLSTPNQFTYLPLLALNEGLAKYGIQNFWLDIYAQAAFHSDGDSPFAIRGVGQFNKLTQDNSYDLQALIRYTWEPENVGFVAIGIEKSWGGNQVASGGLLGLPPSLGGLGPKSLIEDNYWKLHLEAQYPLSKDFFLAGDITHDFERVGGVREDFTAEIRITKLFLPAPPPAK